MLNWNGLTRTIKGAVLAGLGLTLATPAWADSVYTWRTDDGAYAFTDDAKSIPAKYRSRARAHGSGSLSGYARFTPQDSGATRGYASQLAARLEHLRGQNAPVAPEAPAATSPRTLALRTGGPNGLTLDITPGNDPAPIVVETVYTRPAGKVMTRRSQVVRQGDRTLAVVRPRLHEWNVVDDIAIEDTYLD